MAVKVRCPTCEKVLNAPDSARGKAVKCPECETKVKIPAGDSSSGAGSAGSRTTVRRSASNAVKNPAGSESTEFLAGLDLDKIVDTSEAMCPKCGADIPEGATECPKCGVDPNTGQLSSSARKRMSRKGPDPALFYSAAWKDSWAFLKENSTVAVRTGVYFTSMQILLGTLASLANWLSGMPPKIFLGVFMTAAALAFPGWAWWLTIETIRTTAGKKSNIRGIHIDTFRNIALGLKYILWLLIFPAWFPFVGFMAPVAMVHMAMPVTTKGWFSPLLLPAFFRNFLPAMYCWLIGFVTLLVPVGLVGGLVGIMLVCFGMEFLQVMTSTAWPNSLAKWGMYIGGLVIQLVYNFSWGFFLVYNARVVGLLAYYFQNSLDLTTFVTEKTYVRKEVKLDKFGNPIKSTEQKVKEVVIIVVVLAVVAVVGYFVYRRLTSATT